METEQQLLQAISNGDRRALRRLYDRYAPHAMAVALRYVPQREEAADVVQDGFVKILTSVGSFRYRGEGSLKAWVSRVVAHMAIDHVRCPAHQLFADAQPGDLPEMADDEPPDVLRVPPDVLQGLLARLPVGYRLVLNLYVFEGLTHKEIASRLGIKPDSSASQYARAKSRLAIMIKEYLTRQDA